MYSEWNNMDIEYGSITDSIVVPIEVFDDGDWYTSTDTSWGKEYRDNDFDIVLWDIEEFEELLSQALYDYGYDLNLPEGRYELTVSFKIDYDITGIDYGDSIDDIYTGNADVDGDIAIIDIKVS